MKILLRICAGFDKDCQRVCALHGTNGHDGRHVYSLSSGSATVSEAVYQLASGHRSPSDAVWMSSDHLRCPVRVRSTQFSLYSVAALLNAHFSEHTDISLP